MWNILYATICRDIEEVLVKLMITFMKLGNLSIRWHKHKWVKTILYVDEELSMHHDGYLLKVAEKCVADGCGSYRSLYTIRLKEKPTIISLD